MNAFKWVYTGVCAIAWIANGIILARDPSMSHRVSAIASTLLTIAMVVWLWHVAP